MIVIVRERESFVGSWATLGKIEPVIRKSHPVVNPVVSVVLNPCPLTAKDGSFSVVF